MLVEFALIITPLFLLLFGIIEYGLWFTDSVGLRHGSRETARAGAVSRWTGERCDRGPLPGASAHVSSLACVAVHSTPLTVGDLSVRVAIRDIDNNPTTQWVVGGTLRICLMSVHESLTGLYPLPNGGVMTSRIDMAIENAAPGQQEHGGSDPAPTGLNWGWCEAEPNT